MEEDRAGRAAGKVPDEVDDPAPGKAQDGVNRSAPYSLPCSLKAHRK